MMMNGIDIDENEDDEDGEYNEEVEDEGIVSLFFGVSESFVSISLFINHCHHLISFRFTTYMHPFRSCNSDVCDLPRTHVALESLSISVQTTRKNSTFLLHWW